MHDLVDNVTLESINAGKSAAEFVKGKRFVGEKIEVVATDGVRYTVPKYVNPKNIGKFLDVRFRVGQAYKDSYISVYFDENREIHNKKRILTPGEMETVKLLKAQFDKYPDCKRVTIKVEEE